jgi:uncharacterized protein (TIGR03067 family)
MPATLRLFPIVLFACTSATAAPGSKEPPKKDAPNLVGDWELVDAKGGNDRVGNGQPVRVMRFNADGTFQVFENGKAEGKPRKFKHDPTADPPTLDFNAPSPRPDEPLVPGIYKIEKDRLFICTPYPGPNPRPTVFDAQPGSRRILMEYKRIKPKD